MRFWGNVFLLFSLSHPNNLNLCLMCHNYSSCHCAGCLSLSPPAACESCSSGWTVPCWHPLNTWINTGSTEDLRFLVLCTSDLFLKVRVLLLFLELLKYSQLLQNRVGDSSGLHFKILIESKWISDACINSEIILLKSWLVMHACVWSLYVLDMDTLGRGHLCIQALKGLMTNQENTSRFFFTIENEDEWWWNLTWTYILTMMCVYAAFDRQAAFIRWCRGWLSRLLYLWIVWAW